MANVFSNFKLRLPTGRKTLFSVAVFLVVFSIFSYKNTYAATSNGVTVNFDTTHKYNIISSNHNPDPNLVRYFAEDITPGPSQGTVYQINGAEYNQLLSGNSFNTNNGLTNNAIAESKVAPQGATNCSALWSFITFDFFNMIKCGLAYLFYWILALVAIILGAVSILFNFVFEFTVVNIKTNLESIRAIDIGWRAVRDIANICFIFILLYLAIATILQLGEHGVKKSLSTLIIAAVLINFSLFFVKVIIDVPNILAIQIYNKAMSGVTSSTAGKTSGGLGDAFLTMFAPQAVFKGESLGAEGVLNTGLNQSQAGTWNFAQNPFTTFAMGIIVMTVAIAVFLAVVVIFIKRFIMLIFYMIFAPLAFAGMAIPIHSLQSTAREKFWNGLIKEAFYAPIFMLCVYITLVVGYNLNTLPATANLNSFFSQAVGNVVSYSVVMIMLVASLFIAEMMGVKGAAGAMSVYNGVTGGARGMAGAMSGGLYTKTIGGAFQNMFKGGTGDALRARIANGGVISRNLARLQLGAISAGRNAKAGGEMDFEGKVKHRQEEIKRYLEDNHYSAAAIANTLANGAAARQGSVERQAVDNTHHEMKTEQHANTLLQMQTQLDDMNRNNVPQNDPNRVRLMASMQRYYREHGHGRLTQDEAVEVEKMQQEKLLSFHKDQLRRNMFQHAANHGPMVLNAQGVPTVNMTLDGQRTFELLGDRQKADYISALTRNEQAALAQDPHFQTIMSGSFNTFDMIERAGKGAAVAPEMKQQLAAIAYAAVGRVNSARALRNAVADLAEGDITPQQLANIRHEFEQAHDMQVAAGNELNTINQYEQTERGRNDATLRTPNLDRFLPSNQNYVRMIQRIQASRGRI